MSGYTVMQQSDWAGRRFFTAREQRTGRVMYLVAEVADGPSGALRRPGLPALEWLAQEGPVRWLTCALPEGDSLEDLRNGGALNESDLVSALLTVADGLSALARLEPPCVPAYLDPACIKRDPFGRWLLDYLALAQAPEARSPGDLPLGVYQLGVLLYWVITGQTVRLSRVPLHRVDQNVPSDLQFVLIHSLASTYPSLADFRADIERAGRERAFRAILQQLSARRRPLAAVAEEHVAAIPILGSPLGGAGKSRRVFSLEQHRVQLGGPQVPMDDRPWALPERPPGGFRRYVVAPPPDRAKVRWVRWGLASVCMVVLVATGLMMAGRRRPDTAPGLAHGGAEVGQEVPREPAAPAVPTVATAPDTEAAEIRAFTRAAAVTTTPAVSVASTQQAGPPSISPPSPKQTNPATPPVKQPPPAPAVPVRTAPAPGSPDDLDARQGGLPVLVHINGETTGWFYLIPHPTSPWISYATVNRLFKRNLVWMPHEGATIRLLNGPNSVVTSDYVLVDGRLWLKVTPTIQEALGLQVHAYTSTGIYFTVLPL